jgi:hypothetical protein
MTKDEALDLALEALEGNTTNPVIDPDQAAIEDQAITAIKQARSAPVQPVAWRWKNNGEDKWLNEYTYLDRGGPDCPEQCEPLYTTPPAAQRPFVGLTDEEIEDIVDECDGVGWDVAQAIKAKLKEKNT